MPEIRFLQPAFLWFLPLILVPLIILLLLRRRFRVQPFGSLLFLRRIWEKRKRTLRIREILLLLLRMLVLLLIVLLFGRPLLQRGGGRSISMRSASHIIIIDDTFSMRLRNGGSTLFDEAKREASQLLRLLPPSSQCAVLAMSSPRGNWAGSPRDAMANLQNISLTFRSGAFTGTAAALSDLVAQAREPGAAVYVFSDFQASVLDSLSHLRTIAAHKKQIDWTFVQVSAQSPVAIWPDALSLVPRATGADGRLELRMGIISSADLPEVPALDAYIGAEHVARRRVLSRSGPLQDTLTLPLRRSGALSGKIVIDAADDLPEDNAQYFNFFNPPFLRVAVLTDQEGLPPLLDACRRSALQGAQTIQFDRIDAKAWRGSESGYDAIWLFEQSLPSASLKDGLRSFLGQGQGVIITLGSNADAAAFNRLLLGPLGLGELVQPKSGGGFRLVSRLKTQNPLFSGFPQRLREEILFQQYFSINPAPQTSVLAEMDDGSPFLLENRAWGGSLLLMAGSLRDETASNIGQSAFVVPFLYRCIETSCNALRQGVQCGVGEPIGIPLGKGQKLQDPLVWLDPKENAIRFPVALVARGNELRFPAAAEPGNYRLVRAPGETLCVSVNIARTESDVRQATPAQIQGFAAPFRAQWVSGSADFLSDMNRILRGRDLSLVLLILIGLALLAESLLARRFSA